MKTKGQSEYVIDEFTCSNYMCVFSAALRHTHTHAHTHMQSNCKQSFCMCYDSVCVCKCEAKGQVGKGKDRVLKGKRGDEKRRGSNKEGEMKDGGINRGM